MQDLELQAEGLRAAYVLNQEKLNFSHHLLTQREAENRALSQKLKRQMAAQGRTLGSLKVRWAAESVFEQVPAAAVIQACTP